MIDRDKFYYRIFCITFWVVSCTGFVTQEILPFLDVLYRPIMLLADVTLLILGLKTLSNRTEKWLIAIFFAIAILANTVFNHLSLLVTVNGIRDFVPLIFALPLVRYLFVTSRYADKFRESMDRQLFIFLVLQAVCITEQFLRYGAGDHGGGTMGNYCSGIATVSICLTSFYFTTRNWDPDRYLYSLWENRKYIILLYPVFLNETKVCFVLLAIYFALLYRYNFRSVGKVFIALPFMALVLAGAYFAYSSATDNDEADVTSGDFIETYLTGGTDAEEIVELANNAEEYDLFDETWGYEDLPRFLKLGFLFPVLDVDAGGGIWFGAGVGHFKGGTFLDTTPMAKEYRWLIGGTIPMLFFIAFSLGIVGLIWFIAWSLHFIAFKRYNDSLGLKMKIFIGLTILIILFYNDSIRYYPLPFLLYYFAMLSSRNDEDKSKGDELSAPEKP